MAKIDGKLQNLHADNRFAYDLLAYMEPGHCLDVGAASGALTKAIKLASPESSVVAFEPFYGNIPHFHATTAGLTDITLVQAAVAHEPGEMEFFVSVMRPDTGHLAGYSSVGYLVPKGQTRDPAKTRKVPVVTVDEHVSGHIRFMKIDVQGGENDVLRGAEATIADHGIDMIYIEYEDDPRILQFLDSHGYHMFDTEYVYFGDNPEWAEKAFTNCEPVGLTTGATAYRGHISSGIPRDLDGYAKWKSDCKGLQTDILAVHENFMGVFEKSVDTYVAKKGNISA